MRYYWFLKVRNYIGDSLEIDEAGQTLVEYALILLLIAIAVVGAVGLFGGQVNELYQRVVAEWPETP